MPRQFQAGLPLNPGKTFQIHCKFCRAKGKPRIDANKNKSSYRVVRWGAGGVEYGSLSWGSFSKLPVSGAFQRRGCEIWVGT